jgi:hypothetical protein
MCDILFAAREVTRDNISLFAKNSDRPPNEAQHLAWYPARKYSGGEKLKCTYIEIPQVKDFILGALQLHNSSREQRKKYSEECFQRAAAASESWLKIAAEIPAKPSPLHGVAWRGFNKAAGFN